MASFNPYNQYLNIQFGTADQGTLILMTFDGAIRFCNEARECMKKQDDIGKGKWLTQAYDTVAELRKSLKPDVDENLVEQLSSAYEFICHQITLANVLNREEHVGNALTVLEQMRTAWREIIQQQRQNAASNALVG